ncbi:MAG: hypothetical protein QNJ72_20640 [Pleurocapsa sp. MO_226.B13]|nr:hypothetical protein [Pleurocapsa sp. MO_226.B13]
MSESKDTDQKDTLDLDGELGRPSPYNCSVTPSDITPLPSFNDRLRRSP